MKAKTKAKTKEGSLNNKFAVNSKQPTANSKLSFKQTANRQPSVKANQQLRQPTANSKHVVKQLRDQLGRNT